MRVESDRRTKNQGWLHILGESDAAPPLPPKRIVHSHELAPRKRLDRIYSTLVNTHLVLAEEHKQNLVSRGLSEEDIYANGYRSVPTTLYGSNVSRMLSCFDLRGVPGFYKERGAWQMVTPGPGFLIPIRDSRNRIRGFQVRRDDDDPRYLWFSSASKPEGQSSGAPVHFAHPERVEEQESLYITEGALKADIVAARLCVPVVGLPGVSTIPEDFGDNLKRRFPGIREVSIAFDADWKRKRSVKAALLNLITELRRAGLPTKICRWPARFKGFDDYLTQSV